MSENMTPRNPYRRATGIAITVLLLGLAASVAGNIQSILLEEGAHGIGSMISAVWWPLILFLMIEIAIHTPWAKSTADKVVQWLGAGVIGFLAFYISYFHLAHVLSSFGYDVVSRYLGPLAVDTAMIVATVALNRVGAARLALATEELATAKAKELATMATEMATKLTGQEATEGVATEVEPAVATDDLDRDWAGLEDEVASWVAEERQAAPAEELEPATAPTKTATLTTVPAAAAEAIRAGLEAGMDPKELDAKIGAQFDRSDRAARRWRAAVANGTARLS